jgi:hypothetical protein
MWPFIAKTKPTFISAIQRLTVKLTLSVYRPSGQMIGCLKVWRVKNCGKRKATHKTITPFSRK